MTAATTAASTADKAIVYTIAGADSSGGAGVHADLATFRDFDTHGCALITALTTQTRAGVHRITPTPVAHLQHEWQQMLADLPPRAIKLGMLVNGDITRAMAKLLSDCGVPVVCDPVLSASAGGELLDAPGRAALRQLLPSITLLTPNTLEASELTGLPVDSCAGVEAAARRLLALGTGAVLITGGHLGDSERFCHDYFSDGTRSFWLRGERIATPHHHGTGCTLSSAIAANLARGHELVDAVVLGRMAVARGLRRAAPLAGGRGAVAHGGWPHTLEDLPVILPGPPDAFRMPVFPRCDTRTLGLYPVVDSVAWVEKVLEAGVRTVQLRIKQPSSGLRGVIRQAVDLQNRYRARLFINDHWQLAIECGAYGVHLGQEDLQQADIHAIADAGLRLGVSNHAWHELARAHALAPSYMAIGPIFHTTTKVMRFGPQGIPQLRQWVNLLDSHYPVTAIGGIGLHNASSVAATGVGSIAVVRAITEATDYRQAVAAFNRLLEAQ